MDEALELLFARKQNAHDVIHQHKLLEKSKVM